MLAALVMFGAVALVFGGIFWLGMAMERRRDAAMKRVADTLGWRFTSDCDVEAVRSLAGDLPLLAHGHTREAERMMQGRAGGRDVAVVDYCWSDGHDDARISRQQTIALLDLGRALPAFAIKPAGIVERVSDMFGENGAPLAGALRWMQEGSERSAKDIGGDYRLFAENPEAVAAALGARAAELLRGTEGWQLQSSGKALAVFRSGAYVPEKEIAGLVAEAARFAEAIAQSGVG